MYARGRNFSNGYGHQRMLEVETLATATASQLMLEVGILASKPDDAPFLVFCLHQRGEKEENFFKIIKNI